MTEPLKWFKVGKGVRFNRPPSEAEHMAEFKRLRTCEQNVVLYNDMICSYNKLGFDPEQDHELKAEILRRLFVGHSRFSDEDLIAFYEDQLDEAAAGPITESWVLMTATYASGPKFAISMEILTR